MTPRASKSYLRLVTLAVLIPSWMALIDGTVVNVGLDTIAGNLGVSIDEASWISSIYVLAAIFVMPLTGWLATNFGRKRAFLYAVGVFTAGSLLCALSGTLAQLIAMRFVQGIGGGLMLPLAMAALVDAYPPDELASAFKVYGVSVMVGPALGPALGGWVLANATWPWIFLLNVPLGIISLFFVSAVLRDQSERGERSAFDWTSLVIMVARLRGAAVRRAGGPAAAVVRVVHGVTRGASRRRRCSCSCGCSSPRPCRSSISSRSRSRRTRSASCSR